MTRNTLENRMPFVGTQAQTKADAVRSRVVMLLFVVVAVTALRTNVVTLTTYPAVQTDEAWYANLAHNWITTGNRWTTLDVGPYLDGRGQGTTILGAVPTRLGIQGRGLNLQAIRLPSLMAGLVLLGIVGGIGYLLWSGHSGFLAALVLLPQPLFLLGNHLARPEIWLALLVMLALGCSVLGWKRQQPVWDVLAGLLTILSVELHQNGIVFAIGLAGTYVVRYGRTFFKQANSVAFFSVSLIGGVVYLYRNLEGLVFTSAGGDAAMLGTTSSHSIPLLSASPPVWFVNELVRYLVYFGNEPLGALFFGLGLMGALSRRRPADRLLLVWLLGSAAAMMLLISHKLETYLLPIFAVAAVMAGRSIVDLLEWEGTRGRQLAILLVSVSALPTLLILAKSNSQQPIQAQQALRAGVPCERILGPNQHWLAFSDCDYRSWDTVSHYHHIQGLSFAESMAAIRPDYLLIDDTVLGKLRADFDTGGTTGSYYAMPEADFERFLDEQTKIIGGINVPGYGTVQIREVWWEGVG